MNKKRAYVVANAHLDTVWRWTLAETIEKYIPDTLEKNFALIEKYPEYKFNFEGAYRYELIEEFYPLAFEKIKEYVKEGRWCISGSAYENGDVNIPSPEALFRNILLGNNYFKEKFSTKSEDLFLPDCFGFGWALPSIIKNAGLKGFTTQKLSWGSAYGLPMDLGIWRGPDSSEVFTSLNAKSYRHKFTDDVRADVSVIDRVADNAAKGQLPWANHLYGTGDWGGSPDENSVSAVNESVKKNDESDFEIISASSDQIFKDMDKLTAKEKAMLPVWDTELLMTNHGVGCYTSRAASKRLNSNCERIASTAEAICCLAHYNGLSEYPKDVMNSAWKKVIRHQFHDDITGTSLMDVYKESWDDYAMAISQFKNEIRGAGRELAAAVDSSWVRRRNIPITVFNPTQYKRRDAVKAELIVETNTTELSIFNQKGEELPCQISKKNGKHLTVIFEAELEPYGVTVFEARPVKSSITSTQLKITNHSIENSKYKVIFNRNGDIAYFYDKRLKRQLIDKPIKMALLNDTGSLAYPSWEMRKEDIDSEPYCYANTPEFSIQDIGPARISIKIVRNLSASTITQIFSLTPDSEYLSVSNFVDWKSRKSMLKATFPLSAHNSKASYDLGLGVIERSSNNENLYEVPAQKWADVTDESGEFGISIFSDNKYGWDKPDNNTLRLTCIHTPAGAFTKETRQDLQDIGRNMFNFGIYSHESGFENDTQKQSVLFNNPLVAFQSRDRAEGCLPSNISMLSVSDDNVIVRAVKKCEDDDSLIIRVNEGVNRAHTGVLLKLMWEIESVSLVNTSEEHIKKIRANKSSFKFDINPYEVKTFKIKIKNINKENKLSENIPIKLEYNTKGFTSDSNMRNVILQGSGFSLPIELLPERIDIAGIPFEMPQKAEDEFDLLVCRGQAIDIPEDTNIIYMLAASSMDAQRVKILADHKGFVCNMYGMNDFYETCDMYGLNEVGNFAYNSEIGFEFSHTHHPEGNIPRKARFYFFSMSVAGKKKLYLPENNKVVILAMTAHKGARDTKIVSDLFDVLPTKKYDFGEATPIEKITDKTDFITIRAGKIQDQMNSGKGKGIKRDNIITNIIRSYTKSEW